MCRQFLREIIKTDKPLANQTEMAVLIKSEIQKGDITIDTEERDHNDKCSFNVAQKERVKIWGSEREMEREEMNNTFYVYLKLNDIYKYISINIYRRNKVLFIIINYHL